MNPSAWSEWLRERTGADRVWAALMERKIPEARGAASWLYVLGSASLFVFLIQGLTGALIAMSYVPSPDHAYDSLRYLEGEVPLGRFLRGLHHWGASAMVVLVAAHLLRVYFMGAYKYPREATWVSGVGLFLLTLLFSFTGYLLPWDQKAYWATAVGANIAGQAPFVGGALAKVLKGGEELGAATLTRFYAFHVLILPGLTLGLIGLHLSLVVWHGITEPPRRAAREGR